MSLKIAVLLACCGALFAAVPAQAEPKPWVFGWWPGHWEWTEHEKFNPYLDHGRHAHNTQWMGQNWKPQDWISQRPSGLALVNDFYRADILRNQLQEDGTPVLVVGPNFYRLSGYDKRRVIHTVDTVYGVTAADSMATIIVKDWFTRVPVGIYTKSGLQLQ